MNLGTKGYIMAADKERGMHKREITREKRQTRVNTALKSLLLCFLIPGLTGCSSSIFNPLQKEPDPEAYLGQANDHALNEDSDSVANARERLEQSLSTYQQEHTPEPYKPVMMAPVVRLMWIPDHLNRHGDLIPAHYYYLKVLPGRWAAQDKFDIIEQLDTRPSGGGDSSTPSPIPFVQDSR
jgi:hypothetical protein